MMSATRVVRRLSALLVTDVVGYSELMRDDETATYRRVQADVNELFSPKIREYNGRIVKTTGDGLIAEFLSIVECVQCAIVLQDTVAKRRPSIAANSLPEEEEIIYRMGVNLGDVIAENDDIFGDGVNVAARLQQLAEPGGILLSDEAYRQVRGKLDVTFQDLGNQRLKSIAEPVRVFRVALASAKPGRVKHTAAVGRSHASGIPSIAVLPFEDMSGDLAQDYLSDGITNDIIIDLSKFSGLFVIARHTVFTYKGKAIKIEDVGRDLGVRYVVEGTVQRAGERVRIGVRLIDAGSGQHLWAERYDRPMHEFFRVQDEIIHAVVGTLVTRVNSSESQRVLGARPDDVETYDIYLRGRAAWHEWTRESNLLAREYFTKAIDLDPSFSLAYGYLAYTLTQAWIAGWVQSPEVLREAYEMAQKAVALGASESDNHWSLAAAYIYNREFDKGLAAFRRAIDLNPNNPDLLVDMADAFVYVGQVGDAIANVERAMRFNPIYPDNYLWTLGMALYHAGQCELAVVALNKMSNPANLARRHLAAAYVRLGNVAEARRVVAEFLKYDPTYTLDREKLWPYKDPVILESLLTDLRSAGLPES
jgi:adenylate cyclase